MDKSCDTCLFSNFAMPHIVICLAGEHIKEYMHVKNNCKRWLENTASNAKEQLKLLKQEKEL